MRRRLFDSQDYFLCFAFLVPALGRVAVIIQIVAVGKVGRRVLSGHDQYATDGPAARAAAPRSIAVASAFAACPFW